MRMCRTPFPISCCVFWDRYPRSITCGIYPEFSAASRMECTHSDFESRMVDARIEILCVTAFCATRYISSFVTIGWSTSALQALLSSVGSILFHLSTPRLYSALLGNGSGITSGSLFITFCHTFVFYVYDLRG